MTINAKLYDPSTGTWTATDHLVESNQMDLALVELAAILQGRVEGQALLHSNPPSKMLMVALTISCWRSYKEAATRDTEAAHVLLKMKSSLAAFLSSGGFLRFPGSRETFNDSSQN